MTDFTPATTDGPAADPPPTVAGEHYFTADPTAPGGVREVRLVVDGRALALVSSSGVFSSDRIDAGTSVLLQHAPRPPESGEVLDLGCGYGPIACALAVRSPGASVYAVDVNARAVELTRENAARLGLGIRAASPDDLDPHLGFDAIYSNPPIRVGKAVLHALLVRWLDRLTPDGRAYLVVHRHLGSDSLQRWLAEQAYEVERLTSVRGYRILAVGPR